MEEIFKDQETPPIKLIESILVIGFQTNTLRKMFLEGKTSEVPELIAQLPATHNEFTPNHISLLFTHSTLKFETEPKFPHYFSTTFADRGHLHCLITYEKISPSVVEFTKERRVPKGIFNYIPKKENTQSNEPQFYVPVVLGMLTKTNYIDCFRNLLKQLHLYLTLVLENEDKHLNNKIATSEFLRLSSFLLNDMIVPPLDIKLSISIGTEKVSLPVNCLKRLPHNESCVAVLLDLIDIRNIIEFWEAILLNRYSFVLSCNEYLIYLVLEAFNSLLFPTQWALSYFPVLPDHLFELVGAPQPVILGFNSTNITLDRIAQETTECTVLDIDSNLLYSHEILLCNCVKSTISQKLQLIKAYYYVSKERLNTFKMNKLETNLDDQKFVEAARDLLRLEGIEKEDLFVTLIRHAFFSEICKTLYNFEEYLLYNSKNKVYEWNTKEFLPTVDTCGGSCKMIQFWTRFTECQAFIEFMQYYGKYDESLLVRFQQILKNIQNGTYNMQVSNSNFSMNFKPYLKPQEMFQNWIDSLKSLDGNTPKASFQKDSALKFLEALSDSLSQKQSYWRSLEVFKRKGSRKMTLLNLPARNLLDDRSSINLYYGKYGIVRLLNVLYPIDKSISKSPAYFDEEKDYFKSVISSGFEAFSYKEEIPVEIAKSSVLHSLKKLLDFLPKDLEFPDFDCPLNFCDYKEVVSEMLMDLSIPIFSKQSTVDSHILPKIEYKLEASPNSWELHAIKLHYKLRKGDSRPDYLLGICREINNLNPLALPRYFTVKLIDSIYKRNRPLINKLVETEGLLAEMANKYLEAKEAVSGRRSQASETATSEEALENK